MQLHKHFLTDDLKQASQEYWCTMDLLSMIVNLLNQGKAAEAKQLSIDLTKSLHELEKLSEKKYKPARFNELVDQMNASGVHIELIRRKFVDK